MNHANPLAGHPYTGGATDVSTLDHAMLAVEAVCAERRKLASLTPFERALVDWDGRVECDPRLPAGCAIALDAPASPVWLHPLGLRVRLVVAPDVFALLELADHGDPRGEQRLRELELARWEADGGA